MAEFKRSMIRGLAEEGTYVQNDLVTGELNRNDQGVKIQIGKGFIDQTSSSEKMKLEHVPRNFIEKNEKNNRSILGIEELAYSIEHMGLTSPLHVKRTSTGYKLLGGERRLTAIDQLIADENVPSWNEGTLIPVIVQDFDEIDLPLDDELKELFAMVSTNKEARKYTDGDKAKEIEEWKRIISALRKAGVEELNTKNKDGEEIRTPIKGVVTRDILAATTKMSRGAINTFEKVSNRGTEAVKNALLSNMISVQDASRIIDVSESREEQDEVMRQIHEKGDVKKVIKEVKFKKDKTKEVGQLTVKGKEESININSQDQSNIKQYKIGVKEFNSDIKAIKHRLEEKEIMLEGEDLLLYYKYIGELEKLFKINI